MSKELINFDTFNSDFGSVLAENEMFSDSTKHGRKCISELKDRLIEHVSYLGIAQLDFTLYINFPLEYSYYCDVLFPYSPPTHE